MSAAELHSPRNLGLESELAFVAQRAFDARVDDSMSRRLRAAAEAVHRYTIDQCAVAARLNGASVDALRAISALKRGQVRS